MKNEENGSEEGLVASNDNEDDGKTGNDDKTMAKGDKYVELDQNADDMIRQIQSNTNTNANKTKSLATNWTLDECVYFSRPRYRH